MMTLGKRACSGVESHVTARVAQYISLAISFFFFFKPNGVEIAAPEAPWRQGRSRQTLKRENWREVSKTVFADGFSHWLRGEDAGSPGAFLHCTLDIES